MQVTTRLIRDEAGSSLAAVLMVVMVVMAIGVASIQTAQHSNDATSVDRERLQTVQAAEAGVNHALKVLETATGCPALTGYTDLKDRDDVVGQYRTRVDPEAGTTCGETTQRVIHSWGFAPTGGTRAMRHVEVNVELVPQYGFPYSLFAEGGTGSILVKNNATINGDVYSEDLDQSKNNLSAENVVSPGDILTQNNATYSGTLWAGGTVDLGNGSTVGESVLAAGSKSGSPGNVVVGNGGTIGGDVRAKGTITLNGSTVHGSTSANDSLVPPPPVLTKPTFTWNAANYSPAPIQGNATTITNTLNTNKNTLSGVYYNNSGPTSAITIPDGARVTGNLTIVSSGRVALGNSLTAIGGPWTVVIVALSTADNAIDVNKSFTSASGIDLLLYTAGGIDIENNMSMTGSVYADKIDVKNNFTVNRSTVLTQLQPPGFTFTGTSAARYVPVPTLWREIVPGTPPE